MTDPSSLSHYPIGHCGTIVQIDADSESKIQKALSGLLKGRTCFVIAHRFSTVVNADRIVVMDQGRIVAQGRHEELTR